MKLKFIFAILIFSSSSFASICKTNRLTCAARVNGGNLKELSLNTSSNTLKHSENGIELSIACQEDQYNVYAHIQGFVTDKEFFFEISQKAVPDKSNPLGYMGAVTFPNVGLVQVFCHKNY